MANCKFIPARYPPRVKFGPHRIAPLATFAGAMLLLSGCVSDSQPTTTTDICQIFSEHPHWYRATRKSHQKWGAPAYVQMAIIWRESAFRQDIRPPRKHILGIIPWGRQSSSRGFTQAVDGTWDWYIQSSGNSGASRSNFVDSADFVGWYVSKTHQINGVRKSDTYNQYLAYYLGHGSFRKKVYKNKPKARKFARETAAMGDRYRKQMRKCQSRLASYN